MARIEQRAGEHTSQPTPVGDDCVLVSKGRAAVLLVLTEAGELVMVEPLPDAPNEVLGRVEVLSDKTWNTFALAGNRVVIRNATEAACYRLTLAGK